MKNKYIIILILKIHYSNFLCNSVKAMSKTFLHYSNETKMHHTILVNCHENNVIII